MRNRSRLCLLAIVFAFVPLPDASAITIVTHFIGGAPPQNTAGGGNLIDVFNAAARRWESAYDDPFTLTLHFGWAPLGDAATHTLVEQGGDENRELEGTILFDNSGAVSFYLDPTPLIDEEFRRRSDEYQDLGAGLVSVARIYSEPIGDAAGHSDLLSVALHEIGHALGMSGGNASFVAAVREGGIGLTAGLPFAGTVIPLSSNHFGLVPHFDATRVAYGSLMSGVNSDERRLPSALDILANAQISLFKGLNLNPTQERGSSSFSRTSRSVPGDSQEYRGN